VSQNNFKTFATSKSQRLRNLDLTCKLHDSLLMGLSSSSLLRSFNLPAVVNVRPSVMRLNWPLTIRSGFAFLVYCF